MELYSDRGKEHDLRLSMVVSFDKNGGGKKKQGRGWGGKGNVRRLAFGTISKMNMGGHYRGGRKTVGGEIFISTGVKNNIAG